MSVIYICDRCGDQVDHMGPEGVDEVRISWSMTGSYTLYHLCAMCRNDLYEFMKRIER